MKIALLGGTGEFGRGLALRWAKNYSVVIGSRFHDKAEAAAREYDRIAKRHYKDGMSGEITGAENLEAARASDVLVLTIFHTYMLEFVRSLKAALTGEKVVVSPVVPMERRGGSFRYAPLRLFEPTSKFRRVVSASEAVSLELSSRRVVSTLHAIPAAKLADLSLALDYDIPICGDDDESVKLVSRLIKDIPRLRPLYAGPLYNSALLESMAPLLINISSYSGIREPSIKIF